MYTILFDSLHYFAHHTQGHLTHMHTYIFSSFNMVSMYEETTLLNHFFLSMQPSLTGSQFPNQGLNSGHDSESLKSLTIGHQGTHLISFLKLLIYIKWYVSIRHVISLFSCSMWTLSCGTWDLVPWPGIKPRSPALGARLISPWTTRKVPNQLFFLTNF